MKYLKFIGAIFIFLLLPTSCNESNTSFSENMNIMSSSNSEPVTSSVVEVTNTQKNKSNLQEGWDNDTYTILKAGVKLLLPNGWIRSSEKEFSIINLESRIQINSTIWNPPSDDEYLLVETFALGAKDRLNLLENYIKIGNVQKKEISDCIFYVLPAITVQSEKEFSCYTYFKQAWDSVLALQITFPPDLYGLPEQEEKIDHLLASMIQSSPNEASMSVGEWVDNSYIMDWAGMKINIPDEMRLATEVETGPIVPELDQCYVFYTLEKIPTPNVYPVTMILVGIVNGDGTSINDYIESFINSYKKQGNGIATGIQQRVIAGVNFLTSEIHFESADLIVLITEKDNKFIDITYSHAPMEESELTAYLESLISSI